MKGFEIKGFRFESWTPEDNLGPQDLDCDCPPHTVQGESETLESTAWKLNDEA